ncbi:mCG141541, isoform CRA_b, partial [Mus musculus]
EMAAELEPLMAEWLGAEKAEDTRGQAASLNTMEDLLETVKKLQKEGSLEPQIEDLIHRINELQQGPAKKRSSEELGEAQALQEAMHRELDSLNEERVHLEEVLRKKQEAVSILKKHPQERDSDTPHLDAQQLEERLADLARQHKDLWEFHVSPSPGWASVSVSGHSLPLLRSGPLLAAVTAFEDFVLASERPTGPSIKPSFRSIPDRRGWWYTKGPFLPQASEG